MTSMLPQYYMDTYSDLASFDPVRPVLVGQNGAECTLFEIFGVNSIESETDFGDELSEMLGGTISGFLQNAGHKLTISFEVSRNIDDEVSPLFDARRQAAIQKGLDMDTIIDEAESIVRKKANRKKILLACWTAPGAVAKDELKSAIAAEASKRKNRGFRAISAQDLDTILDPVDTAHTAFVKLIKRGLYKSGIVFKELGNEHDRRSDLVEVRRGLLFHETPAQWRPRPAGLRRYPAAKTRHDDDVSEFFNPRVSRQIMSSEAVYSVKQRTIDVGGRSYAVMQVSLFPSSPLPFNSLYDSLAHGNEVIPFRLTFQIDGGKFNGALSQVVAVFAQFFSNETKNIYNAKQGIIEQMRRDDGPAYLKTRILACTWREPHETVEILEKRRSLLQRALSVWGDAQVSDISANPMRSLVETIPGLTIGSQTGLGTMVPVGDSFRMLPFNFSAPVFKRGESVFLTMDGRVAPLEYFSKDMQCWLTVIVATMGSGKSVLMNRMFLDFVSGYIGRNLPFALAIDLGVSSSGTIRLIREALPPEQKHLAVYVRPLNTREYSYNFLDIGFGRRTPLTREFDNAHAFFMRLVDPPENLRKEVGLLLRAIMRGMYRNASDLETSGSPKTWERGIDADVDRACDLAGIHVTSGKTRWWSIVDALMLAGDIVNAVRAQRHAVPTLKDCAAILAAFERDGRDAGTKEFSDEAVRLVRQATSSTIEHYPIFSHATKIDLGVARVAAIDLNEVVVTGDTITPEAQRNNTLMFLMAQAIFIEKIAGHDEEIKNMDFPPAYRDAYSRYWRKRYADIAETEKRMAMDEYHVTGGGPEIAQVVDANARLGRKWGLEIVLASQRIGDFGSLNQMATMIMILNSDGEESRKEAQSTYGFNDAVAGVLREHIHGPDKHGDGGANFLACFRTEVGRRWIVLNNRIGPTMLWALTTMQKDRAVRDELYNRMSVSEALALLAKRYPKGSALDHFNRVAATVSSGDDDTDSVAKKIADMIIREYMV